ncbi:hypothetical protein [Nonomuraea sp. NPDC001023]|uniref:hypothetical protein n=1 Tax=Nonomuraea sp. NPDC001023 TaxID=3154770 RepID=UPI00332B6672
MRWLDQVDALGDTDAWLEGIAPSKIADFAGEADAQDADTLSRYDPVKQVALLACLTHTARMRARDDLAEMLCKRMASHVKRAKAELEEIRARQRATSERLIGTYRQVLERLDPGSETSAAAREAVARAVEAVTSCAGNAGQVQALGEMLSALVVQTHSVQAARTAVEQAGGFAAQLADIEEVAAFHGDAHELLVYRFFKKDRPVAEGRQITADQLGQIAPYLRSHISRFGAYATDDLHRRPDPFDPLLKEVDFTNVDLAA